MTPASSPLPHSIGVGGTPLRKRCAFALVRVRLPTFASVPGGVICSWKGLHSGLPSSERADVEGTGEAFVAATLIQSVLEALSFSAADFTTPPQVFDPPSLSRCLTRSSTMLKDRSDILPRALCSLDMSLPRDSYNTKQRSRHALRPAKSVSLLSRKAPTSRTPPRPSTRAPCSVTRDCASCRHTTRVFLFLHARPPRRSWASFAAGMTLAAAAMTAL